MGLFDSIGGFVSNGGPIGAVSGLLGGGIGHTFGGLAGGAANAAGATNGYVAQNPYDPQALAQALANNNQVYGQQQQLAQALLAQASGQGPNPALSQLHQTTDQNAQAAAGLLASQRGLNPALAARMAAQAQTQANQQAGGQAATLSAEQQLGAQGALGNLYGQIGGQQLQQQQLASGANLETQKANAGIQGQNAQIRGQIVGGAMNGAGAAAGKAAMGAAHGALVPGQAIVPGDSPKNDTVPAMLSPGEIVVPRSHAENAEDAKAFIDHLMSQKPKKKAGSSGPQGFAKVLEAHRALGAALQAVK